MEAVYFICVVLDTLPSHPPKMIVAMITVGQSLSTLTKELHLTGALQ